MYTKLDRNEASSFLVSLLHTGSMLTKFFSISVGAFKHTLRECLSEEKRLCKICGRNFKMSQIVTQLTAYYFQHTGRISQLSPSNLRCNENWTLARDDKNGRLMRYRKYRHQSTLYPSKLTKFVTQLTLNLSRKLSCEYTSRYNILYLTAIYYYTLLSNESQISAGNDSFLRGAASRIAFSLISNFKSDILISK